MTGGDYTELVERLEVLAAWHKPAGDEPTIRPTNKYKAFVDAADAIKALVQEKSELAQLLLDAIKSDLKAESALTECMAHADAMAEWDMASGRDATIAFREWRAKQ